MSNFYEWKIKVNQPFNTMRAAILIYRITPTGETEMLEGGGKIKKYPADVAVEPSIEINAELLPLLQQALQDTTQIKTENENKTQGKLEATERHLSDMRQLLKLK